MPISNTRVTAYREDWANGEVQTTAESPKVYGPFYPGPYTRALFGIERTADVGSQTMDAVLQWRDATGDLTDLLDHAGNAISWVQWTDGQTGLRTLEVGPTVLSSDADDTLTFGTNYKAYNVSLPSELYVEVTGATGTSDAFSGFIEWLP